jgi:hypothetical protein
MDITSRLLMLGSSAGGESYWRLSFPINYTSLYNSDTSHVASDATGNAYMFVQVQNGSNRSRNNIIKVSPEGSVLFNGVKQHNGLNLDFINWITVNASSNTVYTHEQETDFGNSSGGFLAYNSSLTAQQSKTGLNLTQLGKIYVSPSGSIVTASEYSSGSELNLCRLDSTLSVLSQRRITSSGYNFRDTKVAFMTDGKIVVSTAFSSSFSAYSRLIMCFDSAGTTLLWRVSHNDYTNGQYGDVVVDEFNNVYSIVGDWQGSAIHIRKYNSSGIRQWARRISATGALVARAIWHDGKIIVTGHTSAYSNSSPYYLPFMLAMDDTGALSWNNYLDFGIYAQAASRSITPAGSSAFYIPIAYSSTAYLYKLPTNGTLAGASSPINYRAGTWTATTVTPTEGAFTPTIATPSATLTNYTTNTWTNVFPTYTLTQA